MQLTREELIDALSDLADDDPSMDEYSKWVYMGTLRRYSNDSLIEEYENCTGETIQLIDVVDSIRG